MPALIDEAFTHAREQSFRAWQAHQPITSEKRALEADLARDRALITAYLSHPAVHEAAHTALVRDMFTDDEDGEVSIALQAIGARKP
jgi:hypothetical protein